MIMILRPDSITPGRAEAKKIEGKKYIVDISNATSLGIMGTSMSKGIIRR